MRTVAYLFLAAVLTVGLVAFAQDEDAEDDNFSPSEVVEADTAVAFPTDI